MSFKNRLGKLKEEEKVLTSLLNRVTEQLYSLQAEELAIINQLKRTEGFESTSRTIDSNKEIDSSKKPIEDIPSLNLEVGSVLKSLAQGGEHGSIEEEDE